MLEDLRAPAHTGATATVYTHARLRLQRDAIDTLSTALNGPAITEAAEDHGDEPPPCAAYVR